jgi:hypothetical protein
MPSASVRAGLRVSGLLQGTSARRMIGVALKMPRRRFPRREAETALRGPGRAVDHRDRIEYWARSRLASFANASPAISFLKCAVC